MDSVSAFTSRPPLDRPPGPDPLSRGLGWFSIGLGLAELAMPRLLARLIGVDEPGLKTSILVRALGVREVASGINVLLRPRRPGPLWTRVAGDAIDLACVAAAMTNPRSSAPRLAGAAALVAGVTALDAVAARRIGRRHREAQVPVVYSVTINKPPSEVYAFFRQFSQLPLFMTYLESVVETGERRSHWVAKLPVGKLAWNAEITEDVPGECIAWRSIGSPVKLDGRVTFARAPGRPMTEVRVQMDGLAGVLAKSQIKGDLRRFKQVMETGEVLYSDASAHKKPHPAQPARKVELPSQLPFVPHPASAEKGVTP